MKMEKVGTRTHSTYAGNMAAYHLCIINKHDNKLHTKQDFRINQYKKKNTYCTKYNEWEKLDVNGVLTGRREFVYKQRRYLYCFLKNEIVYDKLILISIAIYFYTYDIWQWSIYKLTLAINPVTYLHYLHGRNSPLQEHMSNTGTVNQSLIPLNFSFQ